MSVCVVAEYPWSAALPQAQQEPPGVIICSDTRVTAGGGQLLPWMCSKQEPVAKNILVCYTTSSNAAATIRALKDTPTPWSLAAIGESLRNTHGRYGGTAELVAAVWRNARHQILELMPPDFRPLLRRGIVGIGDRQVLEWFRENFVDVPPPDAAAGFSPQALESLSRMIGRPVELPPPRFPIGQAALSVAAAFVEGIRVAGGSTVGLPVQVMTVQSGEIRAWGVTATVDQTQWESVTIDRDHVRVPKAKPPACPQDRDRRTAVQLYD